MTGRKPAELELELGSASAPRSMRQRRHAERTPGRKSRGDPSWLLTFYVLVLILIPANLTISALGSTGTPAVILGLCALLWWLGAQVYRSRSIRTPTQPIRRAMLFVTVAVLLSYAAATAGPIDGLELSAADRGLLLIASWLGIVLLSSNGLTEIRLLEAPLRTLVLTGGIAAAVGIAQFITQFPLVDLVEIPGLAPNSELTSIYDRAGFTRAAGTSTHPIEFGVVLSMILPIALHFAFSDTHRHRFVRWFPVVMIAVAIPITISRSALLGVVVALAVLMPTWSAQRRRSTYLAILALLAGIYVAVPGMLGALTKLFTGIASDGSALSRTDSYALALDFIQRSPLVGRGLLTFLPQYRILDNQYLMLLIEVGLVGAIAVLVLFIVAIGTAFRSRRESSDPKARGLAQALAAMVAAGAFSFATFDAFSFPQASSLMFFGIGMIGALSITVHRRAAAETSSSWPPQL